MSSRPPADGQGFVAGNVIAKRYRLDRLLGEGGMGVVWAATHTVTRRSVAIKFLRGDPALMSQELRQRFLREARAASAVRHPNVVTISDVFELDDDTPAMVMDLLVGETLGQKLQRESKLSLAQTADILVQVVSAVGTAHALGIVHRDLKPDNIFVLDGSATSNAVRVLDFGIAKELEPDTDGTSTGLITKTGAILGTPCYMSPEQALGEPDIDHRSDIWAIGVIIYECLTGVRPIRGESIGQIVKQILVDGVRPIDELEGELPPDIVRLVGRMLSRQRSSRPSDLNRVRELLSAHTEIVVPAFGAPEQYVDPSPQSLGGLETVRAEHGDQPPARVAPAPRGVDTEGAQSLSSSVPRRSRRWLVSIAVAAGLVLVGTAALRKRSATLEKSESDAADASSSRVNATASAQPAAPIPPPPLPTLAAEKAPPPQAPALVAAKAAVAAAHPSASRAPKSESGATVETPSPAVSSRTFQGGLSEKVPF
jgi:serine/threonine protein kinase